MGWLTDLFGQGPRYLTAASSGATRGIAGPDTKSDDIASMEHKWKLIDDVLEGHDAIKRGGERFLPRFAKESDAKYKRRLHDAPWRPIVPDALENITSRPFTSPVTLSGNASSRMTAFAEDVDGQGNSINIFARNILDDAVAHGVAVFLVDFTRNVARQDGRPKSIADDKAEGVRPFWCHIPVCDLIDVRTQFIKGRERVTHARWLEYPKIADGFAESCIPQVRVIEIKDGGLVYWTIWQQQSNGDFAQTDSGVLTAMTEVPLVRVFTGKKKGTIANKPWSYELCHVALEYYRSLARQTEIENFSGWPMLAGQGIAKGTEEIELGPNTVLFAPPSDGTGGSKWEILGPDAALVGEIGKGPERVLDVFSKLAMEPTVPKAGVTATAAGVDNSRAHSAIEAWAGNLKNGLDEGLAFTAQWLGIADTVTANVSTDFAALTGSTDEAKIIGDAQRRNVISAKTERSELKRRGILGPDFKEEDEEERLAEEQMGLEAEEPMDPVTGEILELN
ncbi:DUF4055 domain-containing protein [Bradyrhizobium sp. AUGA SZCCT0182]|uniref:DUF4055 domain-containing protein n=1 Tax=Bradyrhizobium sp. AUGA SZCCT0182 TaxID=2807667 RepID=UPI001BA792D1|nr:DUF4055 domain-containing protein [Bradyrhizobium sp. AUGA SZCCT0182]MBR1233655.1 DUF4055 domain-containing protein [Bradyrhizobium sp. AUGA SZCCT0182]